jgi:iron complex transport system substrate-binding protein
MHLFFRRFSLYTTLLFVLVSCSSNDKKINTQHIDNQSIIKYATGFDIQYHETHIELQLLHPFLDSEGVISIALNPPGYKGVSHGITTPIEEVVVTSTTHIPFLEMLGMEKALTGFPNTSYVSSQSTRERIDAGLVMDLGNEEQMNTELLLDLMPDAIIGFSLYRDNNMYASIEKLGIPVIMNGDWLEASPLGRAEWIKFFGLLFNKLDEATRIFNAIEHNYLEARLLSSKAQRRPTVISGGLFKDIWNLPAGDSFEATFLEHANMDYLYSDSKGKGSLTLTVEAVYEKAHNADLWFSPSYHESLASMANSNDIYTKFNAFKTGEIYSFVRKKGATGGILYFELAPARPDLVLKDLITIAHPELSIGHDNYFFEALK